MFGRAEELKIICLEKCGQWEKSLTVWFSGDDLFHPFWYRPSQDIFKSGRGSFGTATHINWASPKQTRMCDQSL